MPLLTTERELVRVELPAEGEWVEVKARLSAGERALISQAVLDAKEGPGLVDAARFKGAEIGIVRWSFAEPVTAENIRALDEESHEAIVSRLNELWQRRSEADAKN